MSEEYPGYKLAFIDIETTGTDRKLHNIFQISGRIDDNKGELLEEFNLLFRPISLENVSEEALEKTGMTVEKLQNLEMDAAAAFEKFIGILSRHCDRFNSKDKMQFVAYRASFDNEFIREFFLKMCDNYFGSWFWNPAICVMEMCAIFLLDVRGALPNFKLETLCKCAGLGWDDTKAHDADYDIEQTRKLFYYIRENMKVLGE